MKPAALIVVLIAAYAALGQDCKKPVSPAGVAFSFCIPDHFKDPIPAGDLSAIYSLEGTTSSETRLSFQYRLLNREGVASVWALKLVDKDLPEVTDFASSFGLGGLRRVKRYDL